MNIHSVCYGKLEHLHKLLRSRRMFKVYSVKIENECHLFISEKEHRCTVCTLTSLTKSCQ